MSQIHQLFAAVIAVCVAAAVTPASAQAISADRQISATADAVQHSDSATTDKLNRENLRSAPSGKTLGSSKSAARPDQTAQVTRSAKNRAIRRAIAIRRARAAKAKKAASS